MLALSSVDCRFDLLLCQTKYCHIYFSQESLGNIISHYYFVISIIWEKQLLIYWLCSILHTEVVGLPSQCSIDCFILHRSGWTPSQWSIDCVLSYTQKWLDSVCDLLTVLSYTQKWLDSVCDLLTVFYLTHSSSWTPSQCSIDCSILHRSGWTPSQWSIGC
jgi:hypothetical protein